MTAPNLSIIKRSIYGYCQQAGKHHLLLLRQMMRMTVVTVVQSNVSQKVYSLMTMWFTNIWQRWIPKISVCSVGLCVQQVRDDFWSEQGWHRWLVCQKDRWTVYNRGWMHLTTSALNEIKKQRCRNDVIQILTEIHDRVEKQLNSKRRHYGKMMRCIINVWDDLIKNRKDGSTQRHMSIERATVHSPSIIRTPCSSTVRKVWKWY